MTQAALAPCQRSFHDELQTLCSRSMSRLHWIVTSSIGFRSDDIVAAPASLGVFHAIAKLRGIRQTRHQDNASVIVLERPSDGEVLALVTRLKDDNRLVAYNDETEIDSMSLNSFERATACLFDQETRKIVRVFDRQPRRVPDYLHVELSEASESTLAMHAQRIASLR